MASPVGDLAKTKQQHRTRQVRGREGANVLLQRLKATRQRKSGHPGNPKVCKTLDFSEAADDQDHDTGREEQKEVGKVGKRTAKAKAKAKVSPEPKAKRKPRSKKQADPEPEAPATASSSRPMAEPNPAAALKFPTSDGKQTQVGKSLENSEVCLRLCFV